MLSKTAGTMALVGKAYRNRNFRERQIGVREQLLCALYAALHQVTVRCHALRLLERPGEVISR